jgi:head-tail adaptor
MHYTNRVMPTSRLRLGNRVFNVEAIENVDERGRVLKCLCSEEKATT